MCKTYIKNKLVEAYVIAKSYVKKYASAALVFIAVLAFGGLLSVKYGIVVFFAFLSIAVAAFGVGLVSKSLKLTKESLKTTRESLELTRAATRPFLTLTEAEYSPYFLKVLLRICNTGALPGNEVSIEILLIEPKDEEGSRKSINKTLPSVFPNEEKRLELEVNPEFRNLIDSEVETIRCLVEIKYCWQEKECWTKRIIGWPSEREARQHPIKLEVLAEGSGWQ